jgi:hypothetical protein
MRHLSLRTEEAYVNWIRRFILFHQKRHPAEMNEAEIREFISDLAVNGRISASTQTVALSALLFLYRDVLKKDLPYVSNIVKLLHEEDLEGGYGEVHLPYALARKYPQAPKEWGWQYVFPASSRSIDPRSGKERRHHISDNAVQVAVKKQLPPLT